MLFSYSRVDTFNSCPLKYKYRYIDKLVDVSVPDFNSPLALGSALHKGIEAGREAMVKEYFSKYPVVTTNHYNELIKLEYNLKRIAEIIPSGGVHEIELKTDTFVGYIDYLVPNSKGGYDIYDWKYTNNHDNYNDSGQLHLYKFFAEQLLGIQVDNIYYLFIPKSFVRQKKTESLHEFRRRMIEDLSSKKPYLKKVEYDHKKVLTFFINCAIINDEVSYCKKENKFCGWCEYRKLCQGKEELMVLPKNEKVARTSGTKKKIWIYGRPFSGKTFLANTFPDALILNSDGNVTQIDSPAIMIRDEVTQNGRITKKKLAWELFKETLDELEKGTEFKTVVVDLLEDMYDHCRNYVCTQNGWTHESDDSFRSYDMIRTEFLRTIKRLTMMDYNIVLLSHEDSSRDITTKGGSSTLIKPAIQDKVALKVSGMMDAVFRFENNKGERVISNSGDENVFSGGRIGINATVKATYDEIDKLYF